MKKRSADPTRPDPQNSGKMDNSGENALPILNPSLTAQLNATASCKYYSLISNL